MTNTLPLQVRDDRPLDPLAVNLLRHVDEAARELALDWFIGGATARDIVLTHVYGIDPERATADVDIGVCIEAWANHAALKRRLMETGAFTERRGQAHRLDFREANGLGQMYLDVVPFGGIQDGANEIAWPPDDAIRLNVSGFAEALGAAWLVDIDAGFSVPVASPASLAMLKILAWRDRHRESRKDASDLFILIRWYFEAGNQERVYEEALDLMEHYGYDAGLAASELLGRDTARIASVCTRAQIIEALAPASDIPLIFRHMLDAGALVLAEDTPGRKQQLFMAFRRGFTSACAPSPT